MRVVEGLLFEYDFRRADCFAGVFPPSSGLATFGSLQKAAGGISCLNGVGVQAAAARPAAALVSNGSAAPVLAELVASSSFTLELWLRPSAADIANTGSRLPILALGARVVAERGVAEADCYDERHALLVAQRGAFLEVELLEQLYTDSRGTTSPSCFAAEAYGDTGAPSPYYGYTYYGCTCYGYTYYGYTYYGYAHYDHAYHAYAHYGCTRYGYTYGDTGAPCPSRSPTPSATPLGCDGGCDMARGQGYPPPAPFSATFIEV